MALSRGMEVAHGRRPVTPIRLLTLLTLLSFSAHAAPAEPGCEDGATDPALEALAPLADIAGSDVSARTQQRTIAEILRRVREQADRRREDPSQPVPIVQVDIDLTAVRPEQRAAEALVLTGEEFGIEEFRDPDSLPVLPAYNEASFFAFLDRTGLRSRLPDRRWRRIHETWEGYFWELDWSTDEPSAGLRDFVRAVERAGGKIVFNSARDYTARDVSVASLERAGLQDPVVFLKTNRLISDHAYKRRVQERIAELGLTVAIIDDIGANRVAVREGVGNDVLEVAFLSAGFTNELTHDARSVRWAMSTFEGAR